MDRVYKITTAKRTLRKLFIESNFDQPNGGCGEDVKLLAFGATVSINSASERSFW